jgi:hypothetical protein
LQERLKARLAELQQELAAGQEQLRELQERQARLQQTVLRISGAVQVLEELLAGDTPPSPPGQPAENGPAQTRDGLDVAGLPGAV